MYCALLYIFFFNDTATTEIYTLSLHDALPISDNRAAPCPIRDMPRPVGLGAEADLSDLRLPARHGLAARSAASSSRRRDRKSTRLNSSHANISYAVFCLKKKKQKTLTFHFRYT